jgi:hypothetical protein
LDYAPGELGELDEECEHAEPSVECADLELPVVDNNYLDQFEVAAVHPRDEWKVRAGGRRRGDIDARVA